MAARGVNLKKIELISELTINDLKQNFRETYKRYQVALERLEFLYAEELKVEIQLIKKELEKRKLII